MKYGKGELYFMLKIISNMGNNVLLFAAVFFHAINFGIQNRYA